MSGYLPPASAAVTFSSSESAGAPTSASTWIFGCVRLNSAVSLLNTFCADWFWPCQTTIVTLPPLLVGPGQADARPLPAAGRGPAAAAPRRAQRARREGEQDREPLHRSP